MNRTDSHTMFNSCHLLWILAWETAQGSVGSVEFGACRKRWEKMFLVESTPFTSCCFRCWAEQLLAWHKQLKLLELTKLTTLILNKTVCHELRSVSELYPLVLTPTWGYCSSIYWYSQCWEPCQRNHKVGTSITILSYSFPTDPVNQR